MSNAFLDAATQGKNAWWRYTNVVALVLFATFLGSIPSVIVGLFGYMPPTVQLGQVAVPFIVGLVALVAGVARLHGRSPLTLVTPGRAINWRRIAWGAGVWALLLALSAVIEAGQFPERYQLTGRAGAWLPFALAAVILIPVQTTGIELFFRSYLLQGLGRRVRNGWVLCALSGLIYALPHVFSPEVNMDYWPALAGYLVFGAGLAALTLRTQSAELALGIHAGNNLFLALGAQWRGALVSTPALFTLTSISPWYQLGATAVALGLVWLLVERRRAGAA